MSDFIWLFPGQGSQSVGMGRKLYDANPAAAAVFDRADATLGFSLSKLIFEGPLEELTLTEFAQPALLTFSVAVHEALTSNDASDLALAAAGHSLGEWSAYVCAGALSLEDALHLVHQRGKWMQEAVPTGEGKMVAVLGAEPAVVEQICAAVGQEYRYGDVPGVAGATFNGGGHVVVSGASEAVDEAAKRIVDAGAMRAIPLNVSAPFHSPLMRPVTAKVRAALADVSISAPTLPIASTVNARWVRTAGEVRESLIDQIEAPVLWESALHLAMETGPKEFRVLGAGASLARMVKRLRLGPKVRNISSISDS